jgi:hypothetical protein
MMTKEHVQDFLEMYDSLRNSINDAGGSGSSFSAEKLKDLTVTELITMLATNKIRFIYVGPIGKENG